MTEVKQSGTLISLGEAARSLETTELNVLMHVKRGLLQGVERVDGGWQVTVASLAALLAKGAGKKGAVVCPPSCGKGGGCSACE